MHGKMFVVARETVTETLINETEVDMITETEITETAGAVAGLTETEVESVIAVGETVDLARDRETSEEAVTMPVQVLGTKTRKENDPGQGLDQKIENDTSCRSFAYFIHGLMGISFSKYHVSFRENVLALNEMPESTRTNR